MIRAARYLGVEPWTLAGVPESAGLDCWMRWGLWSQEAEARATAEHHKKAQKDAKRKAGKR